MLIFNLYTNFGAQNLLKREFTTMLRPDNPVLKYLSNQFQFKWSSTFSLFLRFIWFQILILKYKSFAIMLYFG